MAFAGPAAKGDGPEKKEPSAREILDRVAKAYAECETYRDSGEVSITFIQDGKKRLDIRPFTTAFIRPDRFRYQYQATNPANITTRYLIWRNAAEVKSWWDIRPGVQKPESLGLALAGATGVSGGSAHTVPALLMPREVSGFRVTDLPEARRIDDARLDDSDCYRVEGVAFGAPLTVWVDKKTFLIRRLAETRDFGNFQTEQVTTYKPIAGEKVPEEALVFDPPEPKGK